VRPTPDPFPGLDGVPESWLCADCGYDTAPGWLTQAQVRARCEAVGYERAADEVADRQAALAHDPAVASRWEIYMVRPAVWARAGMEPFSGCLCVACLEKRLSRKLKPKDFSDHMFNILPGTPRLLARRKRPPVLPPRPGKRTTLVRRPPA
jgi:hypothetical protein